MTCWGDSPDVFGMLYAVASENIEEDRIFLYEKKTPLSLCKS